MVRYYTAAVEASTTDSDSDKLRDRFNVPDRHRLDNPTSTCCTALRSPLANTTWPIFVIFWSSRDLHWSSTSVADLHQPHSPKTTHHFQAS